VATPKHSYREYGFGACTSGDNCRPKAHPGMTTTSENSVQQRVGRA
jgi:hypothetical protein